MRDKQKQRDSSDSRRRFHMNLDRQLVAGLTVLLILYTIITVGAFWRIPTLEDGHTFFQEAGDATRTLQMMESYNTSDPIKVLQHTFPVHVNGDMEEISHPGVQFSEKAKEKFPASLRVPKFWNPKEYGPDGVRAFLGEGGKRLMTMEEALAVGSFYNGLPTIFASIANYRDPECVPTIESIYKRAKHPERIRVAVIDQVKEGDTLCSTPLLPCEQDPEQALCKYRHLMDFYVSDAKLSVGPVFARHLGNRMYRGEYYAMQVDSHVRFTKDWDDSIVFQWESAKNEYGVLSVYLSDIIGSIDPVTHESIRPNRPIMCKTEYEGNAATKHLRHGQQPEGPPHIHGEPTLHPFWAAGFSFARGHFVVQVPYDQYLPLVFQGEEISIGLRAFTYGYDYYTPENPVCFHMYANKENKERRKKVPLFWENVPAYTGALEKAMKRLNGIIGMGQPGVEYYRVDEKKYGQGQVRKAQKFFKTFGIHTETQTVENNLCRFVGKPMMWKFKPHLRKDKRGLNYDEIDYEWVDPDKQKQQANQKKNLRGQAKKQVKMR